MLYELLSVSEYFETRTTPARLYSDVTVVKTDKYYPPEEWAKDGWELLDIVYPVPRKMSDGSLKPANPAWDGARLYKSGFWMDSAKTKWHTQFLADVTPKPEEPKPEPKPEPEQKEQEQKEESYVMPNWLKLFAVILIALIAIGIGLFVFHAF